MIMSDKGVGAISGASGYYLPGGGVEGMEGDEETLTRELKEECNASIEIVHLIGRATDFLFSKAEDCHFEKRGTFYLARLLTEPDENMVWIPLPNASNLFRQPGHVWAIVQGMRDGVADHREPPIALRTM